MIIGLVNLLVLAGCNPQADKEIKEVNINFYNEVMSDGELLTQEDTKAITVSHVKFNGIVLVCVNRKYYENAFQKLCK